MGEIKSAIELAMERTKNLVMDEQEKRDAALREVEQRISALIRRFMEGMIDERGFLEEYEQVQGAEGEKRIVALDRIAEDVDTRGPEDRLFSVLHMVAGSDLAPEIDAFQERFEKEMKKQEAQVRDRINKRLHAMGISGSAVEPNITAWPEWNEATSRLKDAVKTRVAQWKQRLGATPR